MHTAQNAGMRNARGEFVIDIDSDDELVPNTCRIFMDAWDSVPDDKKHLYREVIALCVDQDGNPIGEPYPENANDMTLEASQKGHGERHGCNLTEIMQANLPPEPEGVK